MLWNWTIDESGVRFELTREEGGVIPPDRWAGVEPRLPDGTRHALRWLALRIEEERAEVEPDGAVRLSHRVVAAIGDSDAATLTLPPPLPHTVVLEGQGTIDQETFRFLWRFVGPDGRPALSPQRWGAFLKIGTRLYRLAEPYYSLLEAAETFNTNPPGTRDERLLAWARIRELIAGNARVTGYLTDLRVYRATAFTLEPYVDQEGNFTFDPVLVSSQLPSGQGDGDVAKPPSTPPGPEGEETVGYVPSLPRHYQSIFAKQFRARPGGLSRYVLSDGWIAVLAEPLRRALTVVHRKMKAPDAERRAFMANPYATLRHEVGGELEALTPPGQDVEDLLNQLFVEPPSYGDRVTGVGGWVRKVIPWTSKPSAAWLPPEDGGLMLDDVRVQVRPDQLGPLEEQIAQARAAGRATVEFQGHALPVTEQTLDALEALASMMVPTEPQEGGQPGPSAEGPQEPPAGPGGRARLVLMIEDNLETLGYHPQPRPHRSGSHDIAHALNVSFKPHQREGFEWLKRHWFDGSPGVLLADDMGLGKTLQALAFMAWVKEEMAAGCARRAPFLVVAPTGLLKNWEDEHDKHLVAPGLGRLVRAYGPGLKELRRIGTVPRGAELSAGGSVLDATALRQADWVLATYETVRDYQHSFGMIQWSVICFDEAQKIKTPGTLVTEAAKALGGEFVIAITGTPVENRLADLWCIMDTAQPGLLGDLKTFSKTYEDPDHAAVLADLKRKLDENEPPPPPPPKPMLRRLKTEHLQGLPPREEHVSRIEMPPAQAERYAAVVSHARRGERDVRTIFKVIHELRAVSLHPSHGGNGSFSDETFISASARLLETIRILDEVAATEQKALVFVEFLEFQAALQGLLQRRYGLAQPPLIINGAVSGDRRKKRVDTFQGRRGFDVMILSPRAGGVGLTLTAATHVIHLSRWWNPAVEDQCSDRVYRIGQDRPVHIHYPLAIHPSYGEYSFDQQLHALIQRKRALSAQLLMPGDVTEEDARRLFNAAVEQEATSG